MEYKNKIFNADFLESIRIVDKSLCHYVVWKSVKNGLFTKRKEGYYTESGYYLGNEEDLLKGSYGITNIQTGDQHKTILICENKKAYYRPYLVFKFVSGDKHYMYFNSIEKCKEKLEYYSKLYLKSTLEF